LNEGAGEKADRTATFPSQQAPHLAAS
jgi:hypothetical protein